MAIDVTCPQCQTTLEAPDELAGKKGKCPKCMNVLGIPQSEPSGEAREPEAQAAPAAKPAQEAPASQATEAEPQAGKPEGEPADAAAQPKKLLSKCPECGQQFAFSEARKGTTINCPKCKKQMTLPT